MRSGRDPRSNPFSTRFVRPGAIPFRFPEGEDAGTLVARLQRQGWWGQIVGPHGSGKSTLLAALLPELERRRAVVRVELHEEDRRLPAAAWSASAGEVLMVDGYEQLGWWSRRGVQGHCRRRGCGLQVTTHFDLGLPELYRTRVTPALARTLIEGLLTEEQRPLVADLDLERHLARHRGSLREVLFDLYDRYEESR
jgi:hypothetical protein